MLWLSYRRACLRWPNNIPDLTDAMHIPVGMIRKLRTWKVRSRL